MYAIANIIYGFPLVSNNTAKIKWSVELNEMIEDDDTDGILLYYSGGGDHIPAAFGIKLDEFDEACAYTKVSKLRLEPTNDEINEFEKLFNELPISIKVEISNISSKPFVFFLWSSS